MDELEQLKTRITKLEQDIDNWKMRNARQAILIHELRELFEEKLVLIYYDKLKQDQTREHELEVAIDYTNWKGKRRWYLIKPLRLVHGSNEYHKEKQWLLEAFDVQEKAIRTFAMKDIHRWIIPDRD